jgi:serine/threonine protein kinase
MSKMFGKYELLGRLGIGGMGVVYLARDSILGRQVALKILEQRMDEGDRMVRRFLHEARVSAALNHPNIVILYDFGMEQGYSFIAMEYLPGETLRAYIERKVPLSLYAKLSVAVQIAKGLEYAHRNSVIHRDIKPGNIQVLPSGEVKLMDFGIAKVAETNMTQTGMAVGTPGYSSPEQIKSLPVTPASDVFSFGIVLYELLTYRRSFEAESTMALLFKIVYEEASAFGPEDEHIPPSVKGLIFRCLAKKPENRFSAFGPILQELRRIQQVIAEDPATPRGDILLDSAPWLPGRSELDPLPANLLFLTPAAGTSATAAVPPMTPSSERPVLPPLASFPTRPPATSTEPATVAIPDLSAQRDRSGEQRALKPARQQEAKAPDLEKTGTYEPSDEQDELEPAEAGGRTRAGWTVLAVLLLVAGSVFATALFLGGPADPDGPGLPERQPTAPPATMVPGALGTDRTEHGAPVVLPPIHPTETPEPRAIVQPTAEPSPPPPAPTSSPVPPDATSTPVPIPPTMTPVPPRPTDTPRPPQATSTPRPPRPTDTPRPPRPTDTPRPPRATSTPVPPRATSTPVPPRPTNTPVPAASDEELIRHALERYRLAYEALDAAAVQRVWPSLSFRQLDRLQQVFRTYDSQTVQIKDVRVTLKGTKATVRATVRRIIAPKVGSRVDDERGMTFELRKAGDGWVIDDIK